MEWKLWQWGWKWQRSFVGDSDTLHRISAVEWSRRLNMGSSKQFDIWTNITCSWSSLYNVLYTWTMCIAHLWRNGDEFFIAPVQKQKRFWSTGFYISKKRLRKMDRVGREFCGNASRRVCKHFTLRRRLMAARSSCQQHWQFHPLLWQVGRSPPYLSILVEAPEAKTPLPMGRVIVWGDPILSEKDRGLMIGKYCNALKTVGQWGTTGVAHDTVHCNGGGCDALLRLTSSIC